MKNIAAALVLWILLTCSDLIAQSGWRMEGQNPSRTNVSVAPGPVSRPAFEVIASNVIGSLRRVSDDGSLILSDGGIVSSYANTGRVRWQANVRDMLNGAVVDLAIASSGTIYASSADALIALSPDSGKPIWAQPVISNLSGVGGEDSGSLVVDSKGTVYFRTGPASGGVQQKLIALNPDGSRKWEYTGPSGSSAGRPVFSNDESTAYLLRPSPSGEGLGTIIGLSAASGQVLFEAPCGTGGRVYAYSPSNVLYTGYANSNLLQFSPDLQSCAVLTSGFVAADTAAVLNSGVLVLDVVLPGTGHSYAAVNPQGRALWFRADPLIGGLAANAQDEAGAILYSISPQTNELIAIRIATGEELWRERFSAPLSGMSAGGDGNLYVVSGTDLLRSAPASNVKKSSLALADGIHALSETTPPSVSITSPASGTTVSGTITISADASDVESGVAGVQFRLDGNNLGVEVTAPPYSISLDTATLLNGSHTLTAVARDQSENQATSAAVTVETRNSGFNFSLSAANVVVTKGQSQTTTITATALAGPPAPVSFSVDGLPSGATASFSPVSCTPNCTSTLTLSSSTSTPAGSYALSVTGYASYIFDGSFHFTVAHTFLNFTVSSVNATFAEKCSQYGTVNCFGFENDAALFYSWTPGTPCDSALSGKTNYTISPDRSGPGNTEAVIQNGLCVFPQIDPTTSRSGAGALKFTIPSNSGPDSSGYFTEIIKQRNADGTFPYIGPGSSLGKVLYFQFYQRFDSNFLSTNFQCVAGECSGWKQATWYGNPPNGTSSGGVEVSLNDALQRGMPQMSGQQGSDSYGVQDIIGCTFANAPLHPACIHYSDGRWMEFTGRIEIRGNSNEPASRVQLWVDGQLAIDYGTAKVNWGGANGDGFGQFLISPYHTNKDPNQAHPEGHTWYDDLVVSTEPIPMVNGAIPMADNAPPSVTNVTTSAITAGTATITWVTDKPADTRVEYGLTSNYGQTTSINPSLVTAHSANLAGLSANTTYHFRAKSADGAGKLGISQDLIFTTAAADTTPPVISGVTVSNISGTSATIAWTTNEASDTQVEYGLTLSYGQTTSLNPSLVTAHSVNLSGLSAGATYHFRVRSRDAANNLATSSDLTFTTLAPPDTTPPVISAVTAANINSSGATIDWSTNEASDSQVEYGLSLSYGNQTILNTAPVAAHAQTLSGLLAGTLYNYRVKSRDAAGNLATSANFTFTTAGPPVTGLIGYWPLNEVAGATTADASGNNHPGTLVNGPIWTAGKVGNGLQLNATDNSNDDDDPRVVIGTAFDVPGVPFTVSAWVRVVDFNDYRAIFSKRDSYVSSSERFDVGLNESSGAVYLVGVNNLQFPYSPPLNTWTHLAIVAGPTDTRLYVNGALRNTLGAFTIGPRTTANAVIGGTGDGAGGDNDPFKGGLDEIRIYNRALTAPEVQQLFLFTESDTTAPVISGVTVSNIAATSATVAWTTNEASDTQVEYGLTTGYGQTTTLDTSMVTAHSVNLSGLSASTTYHFRVKSKDAANNLATSADFTFTTP